MTTSRIGQQSLFIINRNLVAGVDIPAGEKKHVPVDSLHVGVGITGVIDVMRTVAAPGTVEAVAAIDIANAQVPPAAGSLSCLQIGNSLASIFSDLFSAWKSSGGEAALATDW